MMLAGEGFKRAVALSLGLVGAAGFGGVASAQTAPVSFPAADGTVASNQIYKIHQGDEISLIVFGEPTLSPNQPLRVLQGGTVSVPLAGDVLVAGMTTSQASIAVANRLRRFLRDPRVTVAVYSVGPAEALVLGNVKSPGKYALPQPARLTDVLAAAGGLGPTDGNFPDARLERPDGTTTSVSLQKLLHDGDESLNAPVDSGTTVYIPSPAIFNVAVTGAVDKPGLVPLHDGDDLAMAIAVAGASPTLNADLNHVSVTRMGPDGQQTTQTINLYPILKSGDFSHDLKMQKGDLVYVPASAKQQTGNTIGTILGTLRSLVFPF
jgi:polysaccharide export outer membrane protein